MKNHLQHLEPAGGQQESLAGCFVGALTRKKPLDCRTATHLNRCLGLLELTALGVGSTLGLGLYVLAGQVASTKAGPAVVVSFGIAALASTFSALCYAEFAGRIPQAGSAYAYSYIAVGELAAFVIGWNLVLEYVIGAATVARGFSSYLSSVWEALTHSPAPPTTLEAHARHLNSSNATSTAYKQPETLFEEIVEHLCHYFDGLSVLIVCLMTVLLVCGVRGSSRATLVFTAINLTVVACVVGSSLKHLDVNLWRLEASQVPAGQAGGFMPFGWSGVLAGSATCFFGFIGFDTIASSAEEARHPRRNVPLAIVLSLAISTLVYVTVASVQTLVWPYYDQDQVTILAHIFKQLEMPATAWVVSVGAVAGLASSQLGGIIPLPRILYSMAQDSLIYKPLARVNPHTKTPIRATLVGSLLVACLACLFDIEALADMVSIGTLAAYSIVSLSVLILRYQPRKLPAIDDSTILSGRLSLADIVSAEQQLPAAAAAEQLQQPVDRKRLQLGPKQSTPIRVAGSRSLNPQLSVGFQSWFRAAKTAEEAPLGQTEGTLQWFARLRCAAQSPNLLISLDVALCLALSLVGKRLLDLNGGTTQLGQNLQVEQLSWLAGALAASLIAILVGLAKLPTDRGNLHTQDDQMSFKVPLVPLVPTLSILVNLFLMLNLSLLTWLRFGVWMCAGLFIYFTYGIFNSRGYLLHLDK